MASLGWKGTYLQVMPDDAVWDHSISHLHSKAKFLQNIFECSHIQRITPLLDSGSEISFLSDYYSSKYRSQLIRHTPVTHTC